MTLGKRFFVQLALQGHTPKKPPIIIHTLSRQPHPLSVERCRMQDAASRLKYAITLKCKEWYDCVYDDLDQFGQVLPAAKGSVQPILQVGRDFYVGTGSAFRSLEQRYELPTVFPGPHDQYGLPTRQNHFLTNSLLSWNDKTFYPALLPHLQYLLYVAQSRQSPSRNSTTPQPPLIPPPTHPILSHISQIESQLLHPRPTEEETWLFPGSNYPHAADMSIAPSIRRALTIPAVKYEWNFPATRRWLDELDNFLGQGKEDQVDITSEDALQLLKMKYEGDNGVGGTGPDVEVEVDNGGVGVLEIKGKVVRKSYLDMTVEVRVEGAEDPVTVTFPLEDVRRCDGDIGSMGRGKQPNAGSKFRDVD
ncbi:hypothetical protein HK097_002769 [Rhizophlyctis rosea]|uniref:Uncharacterized protein n=1 Tax=Rhizophlyctis rosea TaxID=64517 RepID=A0AAD5S379_9FUNG|nr:hypothetical protein HK097_002769 [Rhizophlyctis rosea]